MEPTESPQTMLFWMVVAAVILGSVGFVALLQWALNLIPNDRFVGLPLPVFVGLMVAAAILAAITWLRHRTPKAP